MGERIMLKTAAAGFIFALLPVQAPEAPPVLRLELYCMRGACIVPEDQLRALVQSNANGVEKVKQCNAPKGSST